jgi:hypothetical protein
MLEPLYRIRFEAESLLGEHPPQFRHPHKKALFDLAYPDGVSSGGDVEVTRWPEQIDDPLSLADHCRITIRPDYFDYLPTNDTGTALEWHVNFADPRLFAAYGSGLFAQDEMQVAEHPILGSVREALLAKGLPAKTSEDAEATPILVRGAERRLVIATNPDADSGRPNGLYGNLFAAAPWAAVARATTRIDPPTLTNLVAIAAPSGGRGDYTEGQIRYVFAAAYTGFAAAVAESRRLYGPTCGVVVHSGFWGCGAFGGNRRLMIALQVLAARVAGVGLLVLHAGNDVGAEEAENGVAAANGLAFRCGESCSLETLIGRAAMVGYRWGVSDGN